MLLTSLVATSWARAKELGSPFLCRCGEGVNVAPEIKVRAIPSGAAAFLLQLVLSLSCPNCDMF